MVNSLQSRLRDSASGNRRIKLDLTKADESSILSVPIDLIQPDPDQPRKSLGNLDELATSILEHGIINPIIVRSTSDETYCIIAGERRYTAAKQAGLREVPVIVRQLEDHALLAVQIIENLHRKDLHPIEEAQAYRRLMEEFDLNQEELAQRVGKSRPTTSETLRILSIDDDLLAKCRMSDIPVSRSLLLEIAKESDGQKQEQMIDAALQGNLSVAKARKASRKKERAPPQSKYKINTSHADIQVTFTTQSYDTADVINALEEALENLRAEPA